MPFFSVIIPLYNKEDYIEDTLKSVLNQTFQDFEVNIINDGSTDNSLEKVEKFKDDRIRLFNQKNQGVSAARNLGIEKSKAEFIALLDADDFWYENHLSELKKQITKFPNAGLYCNNYEINHKENFRKKANLNFNYKNDCLIVEDYFRASTINSVAWTSAVGFSKEKFKDIGKFNVDLKTAQDLDLWIRFALNHQISFNPTITMSYNKYANNSLSKNEYNVIRYNFVNSYSDQEKMNASLKLYLDVNRYAIAIRSKMHGPIWVYKKLKSEIKNSNLNRKQKFLLKLPVFLLKGMRWFHGFLIKNNIYMSSYN